MVGLAVAALAVVPVVARAAEADLIWKGTFAQSGTAGNAGELSGWQLSVDVNSTSGNVYVSDYDYGVQYFDADGNFLGKWAVSYPRALAVDQSTGNVVVITDADSTGSYDSVRVYSPTGTLIRSWGTGTGANRLLMGGEDVAIDYDYGDIYVRGNGPESETVFRFSSTGSLLGTITLPVGSGVGEFIDDDGPFLGSMAVDGGVVYVPDMYADVVRCYNFFGTFVGDIEAPAGVNIDFTPSAVALSGVDGPFGGHLYMADASGSDGVYHWDAMMQFMGNSKTTGAQTDVGDIAVNSTNGKVYTIDLDTNTVGMYWPSSLSEAPVLAKVGGAKFLGNSAGLTALAKKDLRAVARSIKNKGLKTVVVRGYTARYGEGTVSSRIKLSTARAKAARSYLVTYLKSLGVTGVTVTYKGYGSNNPVATNATYKGRQQNRRVEVWAY